MRNWVVFAAAATLWAGPLDAADKLQFGPPESWVVPIEAPAPTSTDDNSAFTTLLDNEQARLDKGSRKFFIETVYRINSPQGLDDGNIRISWDPSTEIATVHKLVIRRGDQVIDVLKLGQKFTTIQRETNLEAGMLDGDLTATLLPEGLQVGDVVDLALTYAHADPITKDSTEVQLATFNGNPIGRGFARLTWPSSLPLSFRTEGGLPAPKVTQQGDTSVIQYDLREIEPLVLPSSAPARFRDGRALNASTFKSWDEIAKLMKPYFDVASSIPPSGPLRAEVDKLKRAPGTSKSKAEAALKLVQDNVRYVALNMGRGGYVPASAETTWSRRFGDCKAKTALLLAILHELHIDSEAVLANTDGNDGLDGRQPELGWFNHVLVRAHIEGKTYWLDGTRSGDTSLDRLKIPAFDWGLPLQDKSALVRMVPEPLRQPQYDVSMDIDAHDGIHAPAPVVISYTFRGEAGREVYLQFSNQPPSQRDRFVRNFFKKVYEDWKNSIVRLDPETVKSDYDPATGDMHYTLTGKAKLDWSDSNFYLNFSSLAFKPNFERTEGVNRDAPIAIDYPSFWKWTESVRLPKAFLSADLKVPDVGTTLIGIEYHRHATVTGDTFTVESSERSIAPEVPYAEAVAAIPRLRELNSRSLSLWVPDDYTPSNTEMAAWLVEKPASLSEFMDRGDALLDLGRNDEAIADFNGAISIDKSKELAYAERAIAYLAKGDKDKALADIDAAAALDPKESVMFRARGLLAESEQKWQDSVQAYTDSLGKDPSNNWTRGHRAIVLAHLNRDDEALADAAAALDKAPKWVDVLRTRDAIFLKRHQCSDVVKDAKMIGGDADGDAELTSTAARYLIVCGRRADAFALFADAIAAKPQAVLFINRAISRTDSDHAGRITDMDLAIALEPEDADWLIYKADEMDRVGDRQSALVIYDKVLKLEPDNFAAAVSRAVLIHRMGRTDEASKVFASLRARAKTPTEFNNMCWEKATAGILLDSALVDCNEALKVKPDAAAYLDSLGMTLLRLGRYDDAIKAYDKAIANGTGAISLMGRSIAWAHMGDPARADADRKAALADDPSIASQAERYGLKF